MNSYGNDGLMFKAVAFAIFIVLSVLIILISIAPSDAAHEDNYGTDKDTAPSIEAPVDSDKATDTSDKQTTDSQTPSDTTTDDDTTNPADPSTDTSADIDTGSESDSQSDTTSAPPKPVDTTPVAPPPTTTSDSLADFLAKYPNTVLGTTEDAGSDYIDKLVFLGDSTTYGLRYYEMLDGGKNTTQVWTPKSGTLTLTQVSFATIVYPETNAEITINAAVAAKKPEYLVITLGVNGVSFMNEDYFKSEYKKMIQGIQATSPDTKIICQSIFPVARTYELLTKINNEKISTANRWIVEIADECGVKYIDTYSALADEEGWLPEKYHNGDGMHLNATSFKIELDNLRTHAFVD